MIRIVVDVMGFDYDPIEAITACRHFKKFHDDVKIIFVGDKSELLKRILESELDQYEIIDAKDVVTCSDNPISYLRNKETSLFKGMKFVADDQADGFLSAGTTAAFVTIANSLIGTIDGINKAAFMSYIPTTDCRGLMLLDEGANLNCTGQDLYQFAQMANAYCRVLRNIEQPRVGLINIGTEEYKGFDFHHEANTYLRADSTINYQGFLETRNIINGTVDIAVCDGYTGNIVLKTLEGALKSINDLLKIQFKKPVNWLGAATSLNVIKTLKNTFNYKNYAGAFVIGLKKNVVKTHGDAKAHEFFSALGMLYDAIKLQLVDVIADLAQKTK